VIPDGVAEAEKSVISFADDGKQSQRGGTQRGTVAGQGT
jgi:hypothetical protein